MVLRAWEPLSDPDLHAFGIVKTIEHGRGVALVEAYLDRAFEGKAALSHALHKNQMLRVDRVDSLLSTLREFEALRFLGKHDLLPAILRGDFKPMRSLSHSEESQIRVHVAKFSHILNASQCAAMRCDSTRGIMLLCLILL